MWACTVSSFPTQARLFDEPQLAALCLETIDKSTPEALSAEGFTDIDIDTLSAVLDRDSLRIKEAKLFTSLLRYVRPSPPNEYYEDVDRQPSGPRLRSLSGRNFSIY